MSQKFSSSNILYFFKHKGSNKNIDSFNISITRFFRWDDYENITTFENYIDLFHRYIEASKFAYAQRSGLGDKNFVKNASEIARNMTTASWAEWVK